MKNSPKDKTKDDIEIFWNLKKLCQDRNIRRPQDLRDMLEENGLEISYPSAYALYHYQPMRVTIKTILAIVKMLNCSVADLLLVRKAEGKPPEEPPPQKKEKVVPISEHQKKLTGGRLKF